MTWSMFAIGWLDLGDREKAAEYMRRNFRNIIGDYYVRNLGSDWFRYHNDNNTHPERESLNLDTICKLIQMYRPMPRGLSMMPSLRVTSNL